MIPEIKVGDVYRVNRDNFYMVYLVTRVDVSVYFTLVYTKSGELLENLRVYYAEFSDWSHKPEFVKL